MTNSFPSISIIIPTFSRPAALQKCLDSLTRLAYPVEEFEVVVVDDGSPDSINPLIETFQVNLNIYLVQQPNAGPATARNTGAAKAKGTYLVFTDDDCALAPDYLSKLAHRIKDEPDAMIGGLTINALPDNLYATASQLLIDYLYDYFNRDPKKTTLFASNNLAVPATHFKAMNGFDTDFPFAAGEDRELCDRWQHEERNMTYAPELIVYHSHAMNLRSFWRQHFNYGRGAFYFHQLRGKRGQPQLMPEPFSFYLNLLRYPWTRRLGWQTWRLARLLFVSQVANMLGFFWESGVRTEYEVLEKKSKTNKWNTVK
ncbi:glycosyltransferase [Chloroflexi bacterium TSY]|nr:glycosyltransferase [Chloroflexi bacterium TSY]